MRTSVASLGALALSACSLASAAALDNRAVLNAVTSRPHLVKRSSPYLNNKTQQFVVDGTKIPDVNFDVGESYAGLLPISSAANETRKLFFWFFPSTNPDASDEVALWFNGGPGCSSLSGLLTENGPFTWDAGTKEPVANTYSWSNLTNMVWVEQPVGVGFTQGTPNITNEVELGQELIGFYKEFAKAFKLENRKVYLTGESYGGYYVPYIADAFINANDSTYYNLKGVGINDPIIGDETIQQQVVIAPYVDYWQNLLYLNDTFISSMHDKAKKCGYADYFDKYLQFPPPSGKFPVLPDPYYVDNGCDMFDFTYNAILEANPCFNIYHITETCPHPWSVLGTVNPGDYIPPDEEVYFNRSDVQNAINAPVGTNWMQCTSTNVFGGASNSPNLSDTSLGPAQDGVLAHVIETTKNVYIGNGDLDFLLNTNGTLLALQNVTWGGKQGFQERPSSHPFIVPDHPDPNGGSLGASGTVGTWGSERGLTFYNVRLAGHELPGYAASAGFRMLEALLGRVKDLSATDNFTTSQNSASSSNSTTSGASNSTSSPSVQTTIAPQTERLHQFSFGKVFDH